MREHDMHAAVSFKKNCRYCAGTGWAHHLDGITMERCPGCRPGSENRWLMDALPFVVALGLYFSGNIHSAGVALSESARLVEDRRLREGLTYEFHSFEPSKTTLPLRRALEKAEAMKMAARMKERMKRSSLT